MPFLYTHPIYIFFAYTVYANICVCMCVSCFFIYIIYFLIIVNIDNN